MTFLFCGIIRSLILSYDTQQGARVLFKDTCGFRGHVRYSKGNHCSQSLYLHDGGFSKRKASLISQRWDPMCSNNVIDLRLDLI